MRDDSKQEALLCLNDLSEVCKHEIEFQELLWQKDYLKASDVASTIIGKLIHGDLRGYRALWNYLAGYVEYLEFVSSKNNALEIRSAEHFKESHRAAPYIQWLTRLQRLKLEDASINDEDINNKLILQSQISGISLCLSKLGTSHARKYDEFEKEIREGLKKPETFEEAQRKLGELLGFSSGNEESQGAPDPWWICENRCVVFEDYINTTKNQSLNITKTRQAASHPNWIKEHRFKDNPNVFITPVVVSPIQKIDSEAIVHAKNLFFWSRDDFLAWAEQALMTIRELRQSFYLDGDLDWQARAADLLKERKIDFLSIEKIVRSRPINETLGHANPKE